MSGPNIPIAVGPCKEVPSNNSNNRRRETRKGYRTYLYRWVYCDSKGIHPRDIEDKVVMHLCDNPSCVRLDHLYLADTKTNLIDMHQKGRHPINGPKGDNANARKYPVSLVSKIQSEYTGRHGEQKALSKKYGISTTHINRIVNKGYVNEGSF